MDPTISVSITYDDPIHGRYCEQSTCILTAQEFERMLSRAMVRTEVVGGMLEQHDMKVVKETRHPLVDTPEAVGV